MSKKCKAYSESKLGLEPADNRKAFYAGWDAALADHIVDANKMVEQPEYASEASTEELMKLNDLPEPLRLAAMLEKTMQWPLHGKAADCLRKMHAALEQPAQQRHISYVCPQCYWSLEEQPAPVAEPFGYFKPEPFGWTDCAETDEGAIALYERPQPSKPLTDDEIDMIYTGIRAVHHDIDSYVFARAIEAAHGIKGEAK